MNNNPMMDLDQVRAVARSVDDAVQRGRVLNASTEAEVRKVTNNQKYSPGYIATEMKRLREEAGQKAALERNVQADGAAALDALKGMSPSDDPGAQVRAARSILNRAVFPNDTAKIAALLMVANTPSSKSQAGLVEALSKAQWALAAAYLDAAELRAEQNPDNADLRSLVNTMERTIAQFENLPGRREAAELAVHLRVKARSLDSVLYAIRTGEPDSGPRDEMIYQMRRDNKSNDEINEAVAALRAREEARARA